MVLGVVVVFATTRFSDPSDREIAQPAADQVNQTQQSNVSHAVISPHEFDPWRDSYAQWMMAVLAIVATGVSGWAISLLSTTLAETKRTADAAILANANTLVAINNDREIGEVQSRAYVRAVACHITYRKGFRPNISLTFRNDGQSPAKDLNAVYMISHDNMVMRTCLGKEGGNISGAISRPIAVSLARGEQQTVTIGVTSSENCPEFAPEKMDTKLLKIEGLIEYQTIFSEARHEIEMDCAFLFVGTTFMGEPGLSLNLPNKVDLKYMPFTHSGWIDDYRAIAGKSIPDRERRTQK